MFSSLKRHRGSGPPLDVVRDIEVAGKVLPLTIRQNARATRMTLRIEPGGRALKLTVPEGLPEREVSAFLTRHQGWLMTKLAKFRTTNELADGGYVMIRGISHRIEATGRMPAPQRPVLSAGSGAKPQGQHTVHFASGTIEVPIYDRATLGAGDRIDGPAIVTQLDATTLIAPGWSGEVHPSGAILLKTH